MKRQRFTLQAAPASLDLDFSGEASINLQAEGGEKGKLPTFEMLAYTGGPMRPKLNPPLPHPVVVDLSKLDITSQKRPALKDHDARQLVGHTLTIKTDGKTLTAGGVVSGTGPAAREVLAAAKNGFAWQVSMGASVTELEFVGPHQTVQVNGRLVAGPVYVARAGRVRELSFLTLGADDDTSARIAAQAAEESTMTFEQWLKAKGFTLAALSDQSKQYLQAQFDAEIKAQDDEDEEDPENDKEKPAKIGKGKKAPTRLQAGDDDEEPELDAVKAERQRLSTERQRLAALTKLTAKYQKRFEADKLATLEAKAIDEEWDADKYELQLLRDARPQAGATPRGGGNGDATKLDAAVIETALSLTAGLSEAAIAKSLPADQKERVMNTALSRDMRGYSLHALMDHVLIQAGHYYGGSRKSEGYIREVLRAERTLEASGFTTLSLSGILSNVANKGLIAAYTAVEVVWSKFCAIRSHGDFKVHTRYRMDSTGAFKKLGADGELKHIGLTDSSYTNQLDTYGAIIALTRQMQINDDLGAFMEIPSFLGRMSALRLEEAAFVLLLANTGNFFHANNRNYMSGAATALAVASLTTAEQKFRDQVDSNGKPVLVSPKTLLCGTPLAVTAENLFAEKLLIATGLASTASKTVEPARNPHAGKYPHVCSPYISNTAIKDQDGEAITGQSSTLWFLFADPAIRAALAVAFLNGQQTPVIESGTTDFNTLGMQWRAYQDFGVGYEDPNAAVMSAGV